MGRKTEGKMGRKKMARMTRNKKDEQKPSVAPTVLK
jgi:hypothetical protein